MSAISRTPKIRRRRERVHSEDRARCLFTILPTSYSGIRLHAPVILRVDFGGNGADGHFECAGKKRNIVRRRYGKHVSSQ
jgi:hypothetical protein